MGQGRENPNLGINLQVVPHITDAIQEWVERVAQVTLKIGSAYGRTSWGSRGVVETFTLRSSGSGQRVADPWAAVRVARGWLPKWYRVVQYASPTDTLLDPLDSHEIHP
jgi:hypothetical protein